MFGCWLVVGIVCSFGFFVVSEWISFILKIAGRFSPLAVTVLKFLKLDLIDHKHCGAVVVKCLSS